MAEIKKESSTTNIPEKVNPWLNLIAGLALVISIVWGLITFFDPIGKNADVSVWVKQEIPVQLPDTVHASPLALVYNNNVINKATVLEVVLVNSGKTTIGENGKYSTFFLECDPNAEMVLLSSASVPPLDYTIKSDTVANKLKIEVALFNPSESITMQLAILNPNDVNQPNIKAYISPNNRIPNLSEPFVTRQEPIKERVTKAYLSPLLYIIWAGLVILWFIPSSRQIFYRLGGFTINPNVNPIIANLGFVILWYLVSFGISSLITAIIVKIYEYSP
jgi:hypothetical protein